MKHTTDNGRIRPSRDNLSYRKLLPYAWLLFSAVWLFYSAGFVSKVLQESPSSAQTLLFLASLMVFAAPFVWLMVRYSCPDTGLTFRELRVRFELLAILAALALYVEIVYGFGIPWRFMYVVVACAVTLPTRYAVWAALASSTFAVAFYGARSGFGAVTANWTNLITFVTSGGGMVIVSRLVVMVRELHEARQEIARLAVSEERLRFARDLHDLLGHSLSLITLKSELAERLLPDTPENEESGKEVRDLQGVARGALREVREAVSGYRKPSLDEELAGACAMLEAAGIGCRTQSEVDTLPTEIEAILTWVMREGVTNVVRHSRAKNCTIRLMRDGDHVRAEVEDDGPGPRLKRARGEVGGSGLSGLAERVENSGGHFEAGALPDGGFGLRVNLPVGEGDPGQNGGRVPPPVSARAWDEEGRS